jgi:hypothetical protein
MAYFYQYVTHFFNTALNINCSKTCIATTFNPSNTDPCVLCHILNSWRSAQKERLVSVLLAVLVAMTVVCLVKTFVGVGVIVNTRSCTVLLERCCIGLEGKEKYQGWMLAAHTHTHTYVCMYVCMYVYIYIYIYIYRHIGLIHMDIVVRSKRLSAKF